MTADRNAWSLSEMEPRKRSFNRIAVYIGRTGVAVAVVAEDAVKAAYRDLAVRLVVETVPDRAAGMVAVGPAKDCVQLCLAYEHFPTRSARAIIDLRSASLRLGRLAARLAHLHRGHNHRWAAVLDLHPACGPPGASGRGFRDGIGYQRLELIIPPRP